MNTLLNVSEWWSRTLWALSWQIGILVGLVWVASLLFRRASPNFRYCLWCIVLVRLCFPMNLALPSGLSGDIRRAVETSAPVVYLAVQQTNMQPVLTDEPVPEFPPEEPTLPATSPPLPLKVKLAMGWAAVSLSILLLVFVKHLRVRRALQSWREAVRPDLLLLVDSLRSRCAITRAVRVRMLPAEHPMQGPAVVGIVQPTILLPAALIEKWSLDELEPVLLHELAHVKRWDLLVNLVQMIVQAVYFFHPLVWLVNARIRQERELVCDDLAVLHTGGRCKRYSQSFVRVLEEAANDAPFLQAAGVGMMERRKPLARRIVRMMSKDYRLYRPLGWLSIVLLLFVSVAAIAIAAERTLPDGAGRAASGPLIMAPLIGFLDDKVKAEWQGQGISGDRAVLDKLQEQTVGIMQKRLDSAGMKDMQITKQANGRISVQIPPSMNATRASLLLTQPGMSRFCPAASRDEVIQAVQEIEKNPSFQGRLTGLLDTRSKDYCPTVPADKHAAAEDVVGEINDARPRLLPEGKMFFLGSKSSPNTLYLIDKSSPMASVKVKSALATPDTDDPGKAKINFSFSDEDAQRFGDLTQSLIGKGLAIFVNWEVQSVPVVRERISKSGQIVGNYTLEEAADIAARISVPEYPAQLLVLYDPTATPANPEPAKVEDVRKAVETRYYSGIDKGLWNRLLCKFLVPVFDPATGEELSFANYDKTKDELSVRNLPDNLAAFEVMITHFRSGHPQTKPVQKNDAAAKPE